MSWLIEFDLFNILDFKIREVTDASDAWEMLSKPEENVAVPVLWEPYFTSAKKQGYTTY